MRRPRWGKGLAGDAMNFTGSVKGILATRWHKGPMSAGVFFHHGRVSANAQACRADRQTANHYRPARLALQISRLRRKRSGFCSTVMDICRKYTIEVIALGVDFKQTRDMEKG
jgi:hypothetical protein